MRFCSFALCISVLVLSLFNFNCAYASAPSDEALSEMTPSYHDTHECVAPEQFGAVGDGVADDTAAVNAAILKASETCGRVCFDGVKHYRCDGIVQLASNVELAMNGCAMTVRKIFTFDRNDPALAYDGFHDIIVRDGVFCSINSFAVAHMKNLLIENCTFLKCVGNHFIEMCASQNVTVRNCRFFGQETEGGIREMLQFDVCEPSSFRSFADKNSAAYDRTPLDQVLIEGCFFSSYQEGETYYPMHCAIGGHVCNTEQNTNLIIRNCKITGSDANGIFLNNWNHALIEGCTIDDIGDQPIGMRYSCNDVEIRNNTFRKYGSEYAIKAVYKNYTKDEISIICNFFFSEGGIADIKIADRLVITGNYCITTHQLNRIENCADSYIKNNLRYDQELQQLFLNSKK